VRWIPVLALVALSCREIQPLDVDSVIDGYQLDGTVTTVNGVPIDGVEVRVWYYYGYVGSTPIDTQKVVVTDSTKIVDIAVYTPDLRFVKQVFLGYRSTGPLPRFRWDGFDQFGAPAPSGKYLMRYALDTVIYKYSPLIVDGRKTAVTDVFGHFTLKGPQLPVGEQFDLYSGPTTYDGTYEIEATVAIDLLKLSHAKRYTSVTLTKNRISNYNFTLE
jgi:hypothetical protein